MRRRVGTALLGAIGRRGASGRLRGRGGSESRGGGGEPRGRRVKEEEGFLQR